jgi:hypothetical protein
MCSRLLPSKMPTRRVRKRAHVDNTV